MKTKIKLNISGVLIIFIVSIAFKPINDYKKINDLKLLEKKVKEFSQKVNTIKSDFVQIKHLDALEVTIESNGKFWFKKLCTAMPLLRSGTGQGNRHGSQSLLH